MTSLPVYLPGFRIRSVLETPNQLWIHASACGKQARCPSCGLRSRRVHSYYTRKPRDLPALGRSIRLVLRVRRFRCRSTTCSQATFSERLPDLLPVRARRTERLTRALQHIGFALGGAAGARLAMHLGIPVSGATLLRIVLATPLPTADALRVFGVDDWAWCKGHQYGTILVDLEARRVLELLPDRTATTLTTWLAAHPSVQILTRDRSTEYAAGMHAGRPEACQIADRWHLLRNVSQMAERLHARLRHMFKDLPEEDRTQTRPFARSSGEEEQRRLNKTRRQRRKSLVRYLYAQGMSMRKIAQTLDLNRTTVARYVHDEAPTRRALRASILDPYLDYLKTRWQEGCTNAQQLWREIKAQGFPGSSRQVTRWVHARRTEPAPSTPRLYREVLLRHRPISSGVRSTILQGLTSPHKELNMRAVLLPDKRAFAHLLTMRQEDMTESEQRSLRYICQNAVVQQTYDLVQELIRMLRHEQPEGFVRWFEEARDSGIGTLSRFAHHLFRDKEAVIAAMLEPWSNGQVEGQINKLKMIKRQMYGRASFPLLRHRLVYHGT